MNAINFLTFLKCLGTDLLKIKNLANVERIRGMGMRRVLCFNKPCRIVFSTNHDIVWEVYHHTKRLPAVQDDILFSVHYLHRYHYLQPFDS